MGLGIALGCHPALEQPVVGADGGDEPVGEDDLGVDVVLFVGVGVDA